MQLEFSNTAILAKKNYRQHSIGFLKTYNDVFLFIFKYFVVERSNIPNFFVFYLFYLF